MVVTWVLRDIWVVFEVAHRWLASCIEAQKQWNLLFQRLAPNIDPGLPSLKYLPSCTSSRGITSHLALVIIQMADIPHRLVLNTSQEDVANMLFFNRPVYLMYYTRRYQAFSFSFYFICYYGPISGCFECSFLFLVWPDLAVGGDGQEV